MYFSFFLTSDTEFLRKSKWWWHQVPSKNNIRNISFKIHTHTHHLTSFCLCVSRWPMVMAIVSLLINIYRLKKGKGQKQMYEKCNQNFRPFPSVPSWQESGRNTQVRYKYLQQQHAKEKQRYWQPCSDVGEKRNSDSQHRCRGRKGIT